MEGESLTTVRDIVLREWFRIRHCLSFTIHSYNLALVVESTRVTAAFAIAALFLSFTVTANFRKIQDGGHHFESKKKRRTK